MSTPLTDKQKRTRAIIFAVLALYLISVTERGLKNLGKDTAPTELLIEHASEKSQMQTKIDLLENKIHGYELEMLKIRTNVDDLSNDQLDSTWATLFD